MSGPHARHNAKSGAPLWLRRGRGGILSDSAAQKRRGRLSLTLGLRAFLVGRLVLAALILDDALPGSLATAAAALPRIIGLLLGHLLGALVDLFALSARHTSLVPCTCINPRRGWQVPRPGPAETAEIS